MAIWEAIMLGLIQGLTEFLPVSSSGHLEIANYIFGIAEPNNLLFTVALHTGTVLSTIVVFYKEIWQLIRGLFKFTMNQETIYLINIFISLLPIMFVGLLFKDQVEALFTSNLLLVGVMLLVTAGLLIFAHKAKPRSLSLTPKRAFIIGIAQAVAVVPGLSRSGSTIAAGILQGVKREEVAKFSFLMVLIPIIGMSILEFRHFGSDTGYSIGTLNVAIGFLTSFVVGLLACRWMVRLVGRGKLMWFAVYCIIAGAASITMGLL